MFNSISRIFITCLTVSLAIHFCGCGSNGPVITKFPVKGTITLNGEKLPYGEILLIPDGAKGNKGPASNAIIKAGQFELSNDTGLVGGAYNIEIVGFDGVAFKTDEGEDIRGKPLLKTPYKTTFEFPKEASTFDHDIKIK